MTDIETKNLTTEEIEIRSDDLNVDEFSWYLPPVDKKKDTVIEISLNNQNWHEVSNGEWSYKYYDAPHVASVTPSFGHVKTSKD
jgi:hypothetical protein